MPGIVDSPAAGNLALEAQGTNALPASAGEVLGVAAAEGFAHAFPSLTAARQTGELGIEPNTGLPLGVLGATRPEGFFGPTLSPEEANAKYGIPGELSWSSPVPAGLAAEQQARKRESLRRADVIARNESPILGGAVARFGAGLVGGLPGIVDPLNLATAFIPFVPEARAAIMAATPLGRFGLGAIQGAAGQALLTPVQALLSAQDHEDYGAVDALLNIALGGIFGGGLHVLTGGPGDRLVRAAPGEAIAAAASPPEIREAQLRAGIADLLDERPVTGPATATDALRYSERNGERFANGPDGTDRLGEISPEIAQAIGREAAPIRLPEGDGRYGEQHLKLPRRAAEIRSAGYNDEVEFAADIARNFNAIYRGDDDRLLLAKENGSPLVAVVELSRRQNHWSIVTASLRRPDYLAKQELLWKRPGPGAPPPPAGGLPLAPGGQSSAPDVDTPAGAVETPEPPEGRFEPPLTEGAAPYERVPRPPQRLAMFLRGLGGVRDEGGELRAMGALRQRPGLMNRNGLPLDEATLRAWEAGFLPGPNGAMGERPEINELLDALDRDLRGRPVYSDQDHLAVLAHDEALARNAEIDRLSADLGIPARGLSREQFWDEVANPLSQDELRRETLARDEAFAAAYDAAEARAAELTPPAEMYDRGQLRTLEEMEAELAQRDRQEAAAQRGGSGAAAAAEPEFGPVDAGALQAGARQRRGGAGARQRADEEAGHRGPRAEAETVETLAAIEAEIAELEREIAAAGESAETGRQVGDRQMDLSPVAKPFLLDRIASRARGAAEDLSEHERQLIERERQLDLEDWVKIVRQAGLCLASRI
jgi:hypothetical protein